MQHGHRHEDLVDAMDHGYADGTLPPGARLDAAGPPRGELAYVHSDGTLSIIDGNVPITWLSQPPDVANAAHSGPPVWKPIRTPASNVIAILRFYGGPGRERDAAEAWAFEITYYFLRGVGEQPAVEYSGGIYTASGMMTTTHPGDHAVTNFTPSGTALSLDAALNPRRRTMLREIYAGRRGWRFDGRDDDGED
jgi:hypothetical protein